MPASRGLVCWRVGDSVYPRSTKGVGEKASTYFGDFGGNRSSSAMAHYVMGIYRDNTIVSSIYTNSEVRYTNYLPTPQPYNTNVVDRFHVVIPMSSSHVNIHNSYSSICMSQRSNYKIYIIEHVSNIHNGYVSPYSSIELASHCASQTHIPMSNCYSRTDMRASTDFGQSLYTAPDSIRMEIAPNMVSAPHVVSNAFHLASPIYNRVEESSANTLALCTNGSNFYKGIKLTIEDLPLEYCQELEAQRLKLEEAFMARYDVTS
jgi:hypothetical protein